LVLFGWLGASAFAAWRLVARPAPRRAYEAPPTGFAVEELRLATRDGEDLGAWFQTPEPGRAAVVLLHGMGGSRSALAPHARRLAGSGRGFLSLSLRSFGDSSGDRLDFGWSARADVVAAIEHLERLAPAAPRVVIGQSLGAAAAIYAAPELGARVQGYVLEGPYRALDKACRDRLEARLFAPLDALAYAGLRLLAPCFLSTPLAELRPSAFITAMPPSTPVLFVAGERDRLAPLADVHALAEACAGRAELAVLRARDHEDLWTLDDEHWRLWDEFLARAESAR
jgi:alpha-beta hydrolase superfamily lysophospholipase